MNVPKLRFKEFEGEWVEKRLGEIATTKGGKRIPRGYSLELENNGFPYITVTDMNNGTVDLNNIRYVPLEIVDKIKNYRISTDDIFISVAGTLGIVGIIPPELNNANLTENANKLTNLKVSQKFLLQILKSSKLFNQIKKVTTIGAQPKLAIYAINNFKFIIPIAKAEQQKIATFLSTIDQKIEQLTKKKTLLESYKKGVMQKIFAQQIRFKRNDGREFEDWEEKRLGDVSIIIMGQSPDSKSYNNHEDGVYLIQGNADIENRVSKPRNWTSKPTKMCQINDLILTVRAPVGAIAKSLHNACIGRGVCATHVTPTKHISIFQPLDKQNSKLEDISSPL